MKNSRRLNVRRMAIIGVLGAISIVLGITPLGFIPVGPTRATIMHIPVIIGAIMEGPLVGGFVGLIFGLFSIFQAITNPTPVSPIFLNPIVSVLPRVLIGFTTYYAYQGTKKLGNKNTKGLLYVLWTGIILYLSYGIYHNIVDSASIWIILMNVLLIFLVLILAYFMETKIKVDSLDIVISTIIGTLTNTVGVLTLIYLLYAERFVGALGLDPNTSRQVIMGIGLTNGIPEAIIAIIIVMSVTSALKARE